MFGQKQGLRNGGSGGTSYPGLGGPGLGGPEELRLSRSVLEQKFFSPFRLWAREDLFFALHLILGRKWDEIRVKTFFFCFFFFCSSPNFGEKMGPRVKTFFFALHLILGRKWDQIRLKTFFCSSPNFGSPASIFVPPGKISL